MQNWDFLLDMTALPNIYKELEFLIHQIVVCNTDNEKMRITFRSLTEKIWALIHSLLNVMKFHYNERLLKLWHTVNNNGYQSEEQNKQLWSQTAYKPDSPLWKLSYILLSLPTHHASISTLRIMFPLTSSNSLLTWCPSWIWPLLHLQGGWWRTVHSHPGKHTG